MDPINIIVIVFLVASISANYSGAKTGMKKAVMSAVERPKSYLQKVPPNVSALILFIGVLGLFEIGTLNYEEFKDLMYLRIIGLVIFVAGSWLQVKSFKSLGESYSQEVVVLKKHEIKITGYYKLIRHPQYLGQIISDIGLGLALLSYAVLISVVVFELPLFIMRARLEEKILLKHFSEQYSTYKKKAGFFIPFVG